MNIREKLKNPANKNMILMLSISAILLIFAGICFTDYIFEEIKLNEYYRDKPIFYLLGKFGNRLVWGFFAITPLIISVLIALFSVVLRIIYSPVNPKRLTAYRIISVFGYSFMVISCLLYSSIFFTDIITAIPAIIFDILVIVVSIILIKNTYLKRILK